MKKGNNWFPPIFYLKSIDYVGHFISNHTKAYDKKIATGSSKS